MDMHVQPPWVNKLLLPPAIKNKQMEHSMTNRLAALIKRVAEPCQVSLEACHCVDEFYLRRIHPLERWKTLAFECSGMTDPSRDPSEGDLLVLFSHC
jgi:hypothetical protein